MGGMSLKLSVAVALGLLAGSVSAHEADKHHPHKGEPTPTPVSAPEIDVGFAVSSLTLLLGGLVILRGRRADPSA
jgi:hypothetical protein